MLTTVIGLYLEVCRLEILPCIQQHEYPCGKTQLWLFVFVIYWPKCPKLGGFALLLLAVNATCNMAITKIVNLVLTYLKKHYVRPN